VNTAEGDELTRRQRPKGVENTGSELWPKIQGDMKSHKKLGWQIYQNRGYPSNETLRGGGEVSRAEKALSKTHAEENLGLFSEHPNSLVKKKYVVNH